MSNLQSRRGSAISSSQNGGASLRNKISGSLKQRMETFRRMSTKKMKREEPEESKDPFADPAMSVVNENMDDDDMSELDRKLDAIDDDMSEALNFTYDVLQISADQTSPYRQAIKDCVSHYKKRTGDNNVDPEQASVSKQMLAIDMEILDAGKRKPGIFVITQGVLILLYKSTKRMVTQPFKFENIQKLSMAENVPSAAALELDEDAN